MTMYEKKIFRLRVLFTVFLVSALSQGILSHAWTAETDSSSPITENSLPPAFSPQSRPDMANATLQLEAHMTEDGPVIKNGLVWRIFTPEPGTDGKLPLIAHSEDGLAKFILAPGDYLVHTAFGKAGVTRRLRLDSGKKFPEKIVLNAGGIKLNAVLPDGKINTSQLKFSIYTDPVDNNEQSLVIPNISPGTLVRLNAGVYHVVSNYGTANATVNSDIRVEAGKLIEATVQHRAAQITLKLVRQKGGEALADTSWAIMNDSGDIIRDIANAYAYIILTEGDYVAVAKNKDQVYQKEFSVASGKDEEIDVLAVPQNSADNKID